MVHTICHLPLYTGRLSRLILTVLDLKRFFNSIGFLWFGCKFPCHTEKDSFCFCFAFILIILKKKHSPDQ